MKQGILRTEEIVWDEKIYPRENISKSVVKEYAQAKNGGSIFPPIWVGFFKNKYYGIDGRHRYEADVLRGEKYHQCEIQNNYLSLEDMYIAAFRANKRHGRRYTSADRLKVAYTLKQMGYNPEDIAKLTDLSVTQIDKRVLPKLRRLEGLRLIKKGKFRKKLDEKVKHTESKPLLSKSEQMFLDDNADWQFDELTKFYNYLQKIELHIEDKRICEVIKNIKNILNTKYPLT